MPEASARKLGASGSVKLPGEVFSEPFHRAVVYEAVRAEQLARRRGTASTLNRTAISGGGAKPWRQKGTGRARAGSIRAPHWTGGAVAFGPTPRGYKVKVNRKARRRALRAALSLHAERGSIAVVEASDYEAPSTKRAAEALEGVVERGRALVLLTDDETACALSFRNLPTAVVLHAREAGVADVVGAAALIVSPAALEELTALAGANAAGEDNGGKAA